MPPVYHRQSPDSTGRPQPIKEVLAELVLRRGYAREQSATACEAAWKTAAGEFFANHSRCGLLKRGVLEVVVANSILLQEITFRKAAVLAELTRLLPDAQIRDIKLRVGAIR
jgi:hypothetical protein